MNKECARLKTLFNELLTRRTVTNELPTWYDAYCSLVELTEPKLLKQVKMNAKPKRTGIPSQHTMLTRGRTVLNNTTIDEVCCFLNSQSSPLLDPLHKLRKNYFLGRQTVLHRGRH